MSKYWVSFRVEPETLGATDAITNELLTFISKYAEQTYQSHAWQWRTVNLDANGQQVKAFQFIEMGDVSGALVTRSITDLVVIEDSFGPKIICQKASVNLPDSLISGIEENPPMGDWDEPGIVKALFQKFRTTQGLDFVTPMLSVVHSREDTNQLIADLENESRDTFLVAVASANNSADEEYLRSVESDVSRLLGTRSYVRVVPRDVLAMVNSEIGVAHSIPPLGARVFGPSVRFDISQDAYRHPTIASIQDEFFNTHLSSLRTKISKIQWQSDTRKFSNQYLAAAHKALRLLQIEQSAAKTEIALKAAVDGDLELLKSQIQDLENDLEEALLLASELEFEATEQRESAEIAQFELEYLSFDLLRERNANRYLRTVIKKHRLFHELSAPPIESTWDKIPATFQELADSINQIAYLRFTGNSEPVNLIDAQGNTRAGVMRCWDSLRALSDYARLKAEGDFEGGLHQYLLGESHDGYKVSAGIFALNESESVRNNPRLAQQRVFKVPKEVQPDETMFMGMHAKLLTGTASSPRMHFLDNTGGDGLIYIGYIGPHLDTAGTN